MKTKSNWRHGAAALALALIGSAALAAPVSTFRVEGTGSTSLDRGTTRTPITTDTTNLPGGGKLIQGGGAQEIRAPGSTQIILASSSARGSARAQPGSLGAFATGSASGPSSASPGTLGGATLATFRALSTQYIPITSSTLPVGSLVDFTTSFLLDGITSSEQPGIGPYVRPGFFDGKTGGFTFIFNAFTVNGVTELYNNDVVSSGTISLPTFSSLSPTIEFGRSFNMKGKVGDFLVLDAQLTVFTDNRAGESSTVDFSNTLKMFADAVTPGLSFIANGHNYSSTVVPVPPGLVLLLSAGASLLGVCRKSGGGIARRGSPRA